MKCQQCDCFLSDDESTRKNPFTGAYYDLCDNCFYDNTDVVADEEESEAEEFQRGQSEDLV